MKRVLVINDLHVGSKHALMPPRVRCETRGKSSSAVTVEYSSEQKVIYQEWLKMLRAVGHVDCCLLNGDLTEGPDRKAYGPDNWTNSMFQQVETAADLISMIKADRYVGTQGSLYHTGDNMSTDEAVLRELNGDFDDDCIIDVEGIHIHASHQISFSQKLHTRANTIGSQLVDALVGEPDFGKVDIVCRAHAHYFVQVNYPSHMGFVNPAWKNRDAFGKRGRNPLTAPRLGYSVIDVDGDRYNFSKHVFHLPPDKLISRVVI
jgi:hypothetical protein